ncbi:hypothetical protein D1013_15000 [Euzebyella marina]|uniref:Uncharacterized protein n=1 Tax=Euzebyella marina TaxID=1761453 RepID=A0A3G2L8J9_9FLAO|nr:hypothetical protein [Euzebyella marina]AYN68589.1 hypothetical protein D1013_15000 [Euzebyella marina]
MDIINRDEIIKQFDLESLLLDKVHRLANGMIKLHGYSKEIAMINALIMAKAMVKIEQVQ